MSISYITEAREALQSTLDAIEFSDPSQKSAILREATLRPPKQKSYGDLSTNSCIVLKQSRNVDSENFSKTLVAAFRAMKGVSDVRLEDNGYVNIKYSEKHWLSNILLVLNEGSEFGLKGMTAEKFIFPVPAEVVDLMSFRERANFEALDRIAALTGAEVTSEPLPGREAAGFPLKTAIAKCGEAKTRFAVLANPPGFIGAFSPILAIDRHYDNPVFAIPYARLMLKRLGVTTEATKTEVGDGVNMSVLKLPEEVALARLLSDWPSALERSMRKGDAFYLASFLQELSLLFFRLNKRVHPVSSNYLTAEAERPARLGLLGALDVILVGGVGLLGVDAVKEYG